MHVLLGDIAINLKAGSITKHGQIIQIRAKTFLVLKYLLENRDTVVTKQRLLDAIWSDVVVQEQVLVQSIKEIRDLLGSEVIKTFPRTGYQWVADVKETTKPSSLFKFSFQQRAALIITTVILLMTLSWWQNSAMNQKSQALSIAILPVENAMNDTKHDWVPLEGMDYLTQQLTHHSDLEVIESNNLLFAIERINSFDFISTEEKVFNIRQNLGADIVVTTKLVGFPQDFQLHYNLYTPHSIERGVEFAPEVQQTFNQLVEKVSQRYGEFKSSPIQPYQSDFSNEAFASGIEYYLQRDFQNAMPFFVTALKSNPNLLVARRYLSASYANTGQIAKGIELMQENIKAAQTLNNNREEIRGFLMIGYWLINWKNRPSLKDLQLQPAEKYIQIARSLAEQHQDQLFLAYAHEELGKLRRQQGQYPHAIKLLNTALEYHQNFRCSYGQTTALIELARVAADQHQFDKADSFFNQAINVANDNGVASNKVWTLLAQADIKQQQSKSQHAINLAQQAMDVANAVNSDHLINRVNAWFSNNPVQEIK